jgi:uncharacterized membrane protein YedE/YeeE
MKYAFLPLGAVFGFLLSRAGATTYDYYAKLFLFEDLQLVWVIGTAVVVGIPGLWLLKRARARALLTGETIELRGKPMTRELPMGALMLGVGWGLSAACPGTVLTMIGEGKLSALFVVAGIVLGTYAYGVRSDAKRVPQR